MDVFGQVVRSSEPTERTALRWDPTGLKGTSGFNLTTGWTEQRPVQTKRVVRNQVLALSNVSEKKGFSICGRM